MPKEGLKPLLIIEDDLGLQSQLRWCFEDYQVFIAGDRTAGIKLLQQHEIPVATLDLGLPPDPTNASAGLATLEEMLHLAPHTKVIVVTGNDDRENAVRSIGLGAYDFYQKPVEPDILQLIIDRAYKVFELEEENRRLIQKRSDSPLEGLITSSKKMLDVCRSVEKLAPTDATTLVLGESGTGKELLARALHDLSPRREQPFVAVNCAAIPENLLESELFGYEKGAFTGATKRTPGKIETANGGTLMLDEIGDLPFSLQAKLLRFLQERVVEHLGGRKEIPVDIRILCATHQDLPELIKAGRFREDLYYRICEVAVEIPPLRQRKGDKLLLARHFLNHYKQRLNRSITSFDKRASICIETYSWPGNVRELKNRIKRAVIIAEGRQITCDDLQLNESLPENAEPDELNLRLARDRAELKILKKALAVSSSNISQAAGLLGISRPTLYDLIRKHRLN